MGDREPHAHAGREIHPGYQPFRGLFPTVAELFSYAQDFREVPVYGMTNLLFLAEASGVPTADWSPNPGRDAYIFSSGQFGTRDFFDILRTAIARLPPAPANVHPLPDDYARRVSRHFRGGVTPAAQRASLELQPVMARCQYCHTEPYLYHRADQEDRGPFIPFHDSREMAKRLADPRYADMVRGTVADDAADHRRMPPPGTMAPLTAEEKISFRAYLDAL